MRSKLRDKTGVVGRAVTSQPASVIHGWSCSTRALDDDGIDHLRALYIEALRPSLRDGVEQAIVESGVDLDALLLDVEGATVDDTTRADACELLAASICIECEGWPADGAWLAAVPKRSRRRSESGCDVLVARLDPSAAEHDQLTSPERLLLASAKHSVGPDLNDLRGKLVRSVTDDLSEGYVAAQLRVLHDHLCEVMPEAQADRVFLFMTDWPSPDGVSIAAFGMADEGRHSEVDAQFQRLPEVAAGIYAFSFVLIPNIERLHERCA